MAIAWELWARYRRYFLYMVGCIVAFALFYPALCARAGIQLDAPEPLASDNLEHLLKPANNEGMSLSMVIQVIELMALLMGPYACIGISLACLCFIFTYTELSVRAPFRIPTRSFLLPISSTFLASWLALAGILAVTFLNLAWRAFVPLPLIDSFAGYVDLLPWVTELLVCQAVVWSLSNFPFTRMLVLMAASCGVAWMAGPPVNDVPFFAQNRAQILVALSFASAILGQIALHKVRHGAWRDWTWTKKIGLLLDATKAQGPEHFLSPARAQFWFQWRVIGRPLFLTVFVIAVVPFLLIGLITFFEGPLGNNETYRLALYLICVPPFLFFCQGSASGIRRHLSFTCARPITSGEVVVAELKVLALCAGMSWMLILGLLCVLPLVGDVAIPSDMPILLEHSSLFWATSPLMFLALIFLTWRFGMAHQFQALVPSKRTGLSMLAAFYGAFMAGGVFIYYARQPDYRDRAFAIALVALAVAMVAKFLVAQWALSTAVKRHLLSSGTTSKYVLIWAGLAVLFLGPVLALWWQAPWIVQFCLLIVLLLPLSRIGLAPMSLARARHG